MGPAYINPNVLSSTQGGITLARVIAFSESVAIDSKYLQTKQIGEKKESHPQKRLFILKLLMLKGNFLRTILSSNWKNCLDENSLRRK